jgi:uncharacterized protein (TIGR00255 family)
VVDLELAKGYAKALGQLKKALRSKESLRLDSISRLPGVLRSAEQAETSPEEAQQRGLWMLEALQQALAMLQAARQREGAALCAELEGKLSASLERVQEIEARSATLAPAMRERQRQRLAEVLEKLSPDDPRLAMEAALLVDKTDIREEVVRFRAHVAEFTRLLAEGGAVGKRLDFLCQELQREANTMGSKSPDAQLAHRVVELKGLIEQVKEQVQNLE